MYVGLLLLEELRKAEDSIPESAARLHSLHACLSDPLPANCAPALCVPMSLALFWPQLTSAPLPCIDNVRHVLAHCV